MGCASNGGCPNAPNSIRAGWSRPIANHFENNFTIGKWYHYSIPSMQTSDTNVVRIFPNWTTPNKSWNGSILPAYYISLKTKNGLDSGLSDIYLDSVSIHLSNATSATDYNYPILIGNGVGSQIGDACFGAGLLLGDKMNDTRTWLIISFDAFDAFDANHQANISLCRYADTREIGNSCFDGIDNDCNGFIDFTVFNNFYTGQSIS